MIFHYNGLVNEQRYFRFFVYRLREEYDFAPKDDIFDSLVAKHPDDTGWKYCLTEELFGK
jgi:hypothetical protein